MDAGVQILVPVNKKMPCFDNTDYCIYKNPQGKHSADWVGFDYTGWVIAEAKGTHSDLIKPWRDGHPELLSSAINQAHWTRVSRQSSGIDEPATRWAVVSRWATEDNKREPSLLAAHDQGKALSPEDYRAVSTILRKAEVVSVIEGMGHGNIVTNGENGIRRISEKEMRRILIEIGPDSYIAAVAGPMGLRAIHEQYSLQKWFRLLPESNLAVLLLSPAYVKAVMDGRSESGEPIAKEHWARQAGLTAVWANSMDVVETVPAYPL